MTDSQNGYTANIESLIKSFHIPHCNRTIRLRQGPPGLMLVHFATWYDREVEPLDQGVWDEWGYAERDIRGSTEVSNHASGTAMDLNATKHGLGTEARASLSAHQIEKIHKRLKLYNGCIRWGGDYSGRTDPMHYEINKNFDAVLHTWRKLRKTPVGRLVLHANNG